VRARIVERTGIRPHTVELLQPGTLPRTSSGKLRRAEALRQLVEGELRPPHKISLLRMAREGGALGRGAGAPALLAMIWTSRSAAAVPLGSPPPCTPRAPGSPTLVLERTPGVPDKACGEGLMPRGLEALERLSVLGEVAGDQCTPFRGIRYVQEDGSSVEGRFRARNGLGVRRTALSQALQRRAREAGAEIRNAGVRSMSGGRLDTDAGTVEARLVIAADGLNSALRRAAGLELPVRGPRDSGSGVTSASRLGATWWRCTGRRARRPTSRRSDRAA